jgi:hypothetical protein
MVNPLLSTPIGPQLIVISILCRIKNKVRQPPKGQQWLAVVGKVNLSRAGLFQPKTFPSPGPSRYCQNQHHNNPNKCGSFSISIHKFLLIPILFTLIYHNHVVSVRLCPSLPPDSRYSTFIRRSFYGLFVTQTNRIISASANSIMIWIVLYGKKKSRHSRDSTLFFGFVNFGNYYLFRI